MLFSNTIFINNKKTFYLQNDTSLRFETGSTFWQFDDNLDGEYELFLPSFINGKVLMDEWVLNLSFNRLRRYGHVMRTTDNHIVRKSFSMADIKKGRGRSQVTWLTNVQRDMKEMGIRPFSHYPIRYRSQ